MGIKKKILILVPAETASGGIKNYFQVLKDSFSLPIEYMIRGARNWPYRNSFYFEFKRTYSDLVKFIRRINIGDIRLVQTSTSLGLFSIIRDGLFIYFAHKKKIKTIVFFRGWKNDFEKKIENKFLWLFKYIFFRSDAMIVLASQFKRKLISWGYDKKIYIETTIIDEKLIQSIDIEQLNKFKLENDKNNCINILFLARVEIEKGIYEAINTLRIVQANNPTKKIYLYVAGDGKELNSVKKYVKSQNIQNILFLGFVEGDTKKDVLLKSDIYLFPTYTEGMPNSILEAMAFGLPIITRKVGAIPDIIKNNFNGFYTCSKDPIIFAKYIQRLINNIELRFSILKNNYQNAINTYTKPIVMQRVEKIYKEIIDETANTTA